jgi:hypothetical protein
MPRRRSFGKNAIQYKHIGVLVSLLTISRLCVLSAEDPSTGTRYHLEVMQAHSLSRIKNFIEADTRVGTIFSEIIPTALKYYVCHGLHLVRTALHEV